jgi:hypothetical protein
MNRFILSLFILLALSVLPLAAETIGTNVVDVQEHSSGDVYHFVVSKDGKKFGTNDWDSFAGPNVVEWEVIDRVGNPQPRMFIYAWTHGSFSADVQFHKAIMKRVFSRWPVSDFETIEFVGGLGGAPNWSWEVAIAAASSKSADYQDYKANYPHSKVTSPFELYSQFVNETKAYFPLRDTFREFGADLEFLSGEKEVFNARAEDLPFYSQLRAMGINGRTRVIYDAMGNGFSIKPWPSTNGLAH